MLPPMSTGCPTSRKASGRLGMAGPEGARRALAMDEQLAPLAVDRVLLDLAGVVRDVEEQRADRHSGRSARRLAARSGR